MVVDSLDGFARNARFGVAVHWQLATGNWQLATGNWQHRRCGAAARDWPLTGDRPYADGASAGKLAYDNVCWDLCRALASGSTRQRTAKLIRLASELGTTLGDTVALVTRRFRQGQMAEQLAVPLTPDESAWLDADLG